MLPSFPMFYYLSALTKGHERAYTTGTSQFCYSKCKMKERVKGLGPGEPSLSGLQMATVSVLTGHALSFLHERMRRVSS